MASANWLKLTRQAVGGMRVHFDLEKRKTLNHANEDINKDLTDKNYYFGADSYGEAVERLYQRVADVDALAPPERVRKDRVVAVNIETKCPQAITDAGRSDDFFEAVYELEKEYFGIENVMVGCVHKDEVHQYHEMVDGVDVTKTSLEHMHTMIAAYVEWDEKQYVRDEAGHFVKDENGKKIPKLDENGEQKVMHREGVNGKHFETKARLTEFNNELDKMCRDKFGVPYNTKETAKHKTVEQLKEQGKAYQQYLAEEKALTDKVTAKQAEVDRLDAALADRKAALAEQEAALERTQREQKTQALILAAQKGAVRMGGERVRRLIPHDDAWKVARTETERQFAEENRGRQEQKGR